MLDNDTKNTSKSWKEWYSILFLKIPQGPQGIDSFSLIPQGVKISEELPSLDLLYDDPKMANSSKNGTIVHKVQRKSKIIKRLASN